MKRRTAISGFLLLLFLVGSLLYGLNSNEEGQSRFKALWVKWKVSGEKLPTPPTEGEKLPLDPNVSQPSPSNAKEEKLTYNQHMEKGDVFFEKGFYSLASSEYAKAAQLERGRVEPHLQLVDTYLKLLNYDQAMASTQAVLQLDPRSTEAQFLQALIQLKQSDFSKAKLALDQLHPSPPLKAKVTYYQALLEALFDNHERAQTLLEQAKSEGTDAQLTPFVDEVLRAYQEFSLAQLAEGAYLEQLLARAYNEVGEYQMTIYSMKELLKERPELRDAWILYGFAYLNLQQPAFAKTAFERAYQLDSTWTPTQFFLALTHQALGNKEEAVKFFNFALANQFQPEIVAQKYLADLQFELKNYPASVKAYQRVIELNNQDLKAYTRPIWIYLELLQQPEQALALAEIALALFPEEAMAYNLVGWSQTGTRDYSEAESNLKRALELDPHLAAAELNLGKLYQSKRQYPLALSHYQQAYERDQNGSIGNLAAQAYNDLLVLQVMEGEE